MLFFFATDIVLRSVSYLVSSNERFGSLREEPGRCKTFSKLSHGPFCGHCTIKKKLIITRLLRSCKFLTPYCFKSLTILLSNAFSLVKLPYFHDSILEIRNKQLFTFCGRKPVTLDEFILINRKKVILSRNLNVAG